MASGGPRPANVPVLVHGVPMQNLQQLPSSQHIQRAQQQMAQLAAQQQRQAQAAQAQAQAAQAQPMVHHQFIGRSSAPQSKYADLLVVIEDMGRDIRPTYAGSRMATERLKRGIVHAKSLVRECLAETERSARN